MFVRLFAKLTSSDKLYMNKPESEYLYHTVKVDFMFKNPQVLHEYNQFIS